MLFLYNVYIFVLVRNPSTDINKSKFKQGNITGSTLLSLDVSDFVFYVFRLAKQRAALTEKVNQEQANQTAVNAAQLKATLEMQLKQQRLALQQKRLLEAQGKTTEAASTTPSIITATLSSSGGGTIIKTISTSTGSLIGTGPTSILKNVQVQPKSLLSPSGNLSFIYY